MPLCNNSLAIGSTNDHSIPSTCYVPPERLLVDNHLLLAELINQSLIQVPLELNPLGIRELLQQR
jgi:hypothetical protein